MKVTILIPCYNEEKSIRKSAESWLAQLRPADEIVVVDDCSIDRTSEILAEINKECGNRIVVVRPPRNTGNKSSAQEYGLRFVTGDVMITTDGDTLLHQDFVKNIEKDLTDPNITAVGGYVKSLKYNWLTACRALDYTIGHNIDKLAQDYVNYMFVMPGAAAAFRTDTFRRLGFDHDTITEDLDFTYKLHKMGCKIKYDREAICYTQDPTTLDSYVNQMRRWFGGGWQNFVKHISFPNKPGMALELSLLYGEGLIFSILLFVLPFINLIYAGLFLVLYFVFIFCLSFYGARREKRWDLLLILPQYIFIKYVNAYIYLEQFTKEVILRRKNLVWFKPERVEMA